MPERRSTLTCPGIVEDVEDLTVVPEAGIDYIEFGHSYGEPAQDIDVTLSPEADDAPYIHVFLRLRVGEHYAFDLTAAQYGYFRTVTPYEEYAQRIVLQQRNPELSGTTAMRTRNRRDKCVTDALAGAADEEGAREGICTLVEDAYQKRMDATIEKWLKCQGCSLASLLRTLDDASFEQMLATRVEELRSQFQELEEDIGKHPDGLMGWIGPDVTDDMSKWKEWRIR